MSEDRRLEAMIDAIYESGLAPLNVMEEELDREDVAEYAVKLLASFDAALEEEDPTPQHQWEVTTPPEVYGIGIHEEPRI